MLAYDYGRAVVKSQRLLKRYGQEGQLIRMVPGAGPRHNPGSPTPDPTPATFAVLTYEQDEVDGTRIKATHLKVLMAPGTEFDPEPGMKLEEASGKQLTIIKADPFRPAETTVLWTIQAERI